MDIHWGDRVITKDTANDFSFHANTPTLSFSCSVKHSIRDHLVMIVGGIGLVIYIVLKIRSWLFNRKAYALSNEVYDALKADLQGMDKGMKGISEKDMLDKFMTL